MLTTDEYLNEWNNEDESYDRVCCICCSPCEKEYWGVCVSCARPVCLDCAFAVGTENECEECFG